MSRRIQYLEFLEKGGDINKLPYPVAPEDEFLYKACIYGMGLEKKPQGFYRCTLQSGATAQNFFSGIYDLGVGHKVTSAKVKFRFTLRGTQMPTSMTLRMFASNNPNRNKVDQNNEYLVDKNLTGLNLTSGSEIVAEGEYIATSTNTKNLSGFRYLKPFIMMVKGSDNTAKHQIDVHEITVEINNVIYDITDTVRDFGAQNGSKIEYVGTSLSSESVRLRKSKFHNKTLVCLGDSITYGLAPNMSTPTQLDNPWVAQLQDLCGVTNVKNYGISSSTVATNSKVTTWTNYRNPMVSRYNNMDSDADVVIFKGGINDFWLNVPLGTFDPTGAVATTETYYDALNVLFKGLRAKYPTQPIVAMTHLDYNDKNDPTYATYGSIGNANKNTLDQFRQAVRDVAGLYNIKVFELQQAVGFTAHNDSDYTTYIPDGLHPNQAGADIMAKVIADYINSLV